MRQGNFEQPRLRKAFPSNVPAKPMTPTAGTRTMLREAIAAPNSTTLSNEFPRRSCLRYPGSGSRNAPHQRQTDRRLQGGRVGKTRFAPPGHSRRAAFGSVVRGKIAADFAARVNK